VINNVAGATFDDVHDAAGALDQPRVASSAASKLAKTGSSSTIKTWAAGAAGGARRGPGSRVRARRSPGKIHARLEGIERRLGLLTEGRS